MYAFWQPQLCVASARLELIHTLWLNKQSQDMLENAFMAASIVCYKCLSGTDTPMQLVLQTIKPA